MGLWSGRNGDKGRRIKPPPTFFRRKAPDAEELGIPPARDEDDDPSTWPLHVKPVGLIRWPVILGWARGTPLEDAADRAHRWCTTADFFLPLRQPLITERLPYARIAPHHIATLLDCGKLQPHRGAIDGFVKGWLLEQPAKRRLRPIFEPDLNGRLRRDALPQLAYPSRLERRAAAVGGRRRSAGGWRRSSIFRPGST
ncbi:MAG: hypothetical protein Q8R01_15880, partial [Ramlibacter sp.]|nr:hypothetical protein [Ramlibacter sp.]